MYGPVYACCTLVIVSRDCSVERYKVELNVVLDKSRPVMLEVGNGNERKNTLWN